MKFLIQTVNKKVVHDFSFTLLESIRFQNWIRDEKKMKFKLLDYHEVLEPDDIYPIDFKPIHKDYIPIGSVEFVTEFLQTFYGLTPKPKNVPEELMKEFTGREIFNGTEKDIIGSKFVKSNDKIKSFADFCEEAPPGNYQISEIINIDTEWRAFVYKNRLMGLQNYGGDFTTFPSVPAIDQMIKAYKSSPIAYTLDVGVTSHWAKTVVIEVHDFFSCGLYGFADHNCLPFMFSNWFYEFIKQKS